MILISTHFCSQSGPFPLIPVVGRPKKKGQLFNIQANPAESFSIVRTEYGSKR